MAGFHFSPRPNRAAEIGWREWSPEAFEEARQSDRPILLSISAVWCHWCHVMDETTYSDQNVIDFITRDWVPIRVDNDVRPDINQRYNMGGWPTTAFLTPSGDILTGATYLPPDQMVGALGQVQRLYHSRKAEIVAKSLEGRSRAAGALASSAGSLDPGVVDVVLSAVETAYDPVHGGFGGAPKFPQTDALCLLAEQGGLRNDPGLVEMARHSLRAMAGGGTYDHVEGGFFRYSTTEDWSVPHFEKMLEDHAGLVAALALTGLAEILDSATAYLDRVLRDPATGLYAGSQDADEEYYARDADGRSLLPAPYVDRRAYTSWNCGLAIAYLEADRRLDRPLLRQHAAACLESVFKERWQNGGLDRLPGEGGLLGDQVFGLWAAVRAYQAGLGSEWLERAHGLAAHLQEHYADERFGGYLDRVPGAELGRLGEPVKALPENSVAAIALLELDALTGDASGPHRARAQSALESVAGLPRQYGLMAAVFARSLDRFQRPAVKVTTGSPDLARAALQANPYVVIEPGEDRAIVCVGTLCLAPTQDAAAVAEAVRRT